MKKSQLRNIIREIINEQSGCPGWAGYSNWLNNFTSLPNFSSSNPNQPCQLLCGKETQWSNTLTNAGPVQANQLQCKLDEVQSLMQTHNCSTSNASNCASTNPSPPPPVPGCMGFSGPFSGNWNGNLAPSGNGVCTGGPNINQTFTSGSLNYNPLATVDDGSCIPVILGCTNPSAYNYYPGACIELYPDSGTNPVYNVNGTNPTCCYVTGCMDPNASNYDPTACMGDGSC